MVLSGGGGSLYIYTKTWTSIIPLKQISTIFFLHILFKTPSSKYQLYEKFNSNGSAVENLVVVTERHIGSSSTLAETITAVTCPLKSGQDPTGRLIQEAIRTHVDWGSVNNYNNKAHCKSVTHLDRIHDLFASLCRLISITKSLFVCFCQNRFFSPNSGRKLKSN